MLRYLHLDTVIYFNIYKVILNIHGFHVYEFTYLIKCICKLSAEVLSVPKHKNVIFLTEKIYVFNNLELGML